MIVCPPSRGRPRRAGRMLMAGLLGKIEGFRGRTHRLDWALCVVLDPYDAVDYVWDRMLYAGGQDEEGVRQWLAGDSAPGSKLIFGGKPLGLQFAYRVS